MAKVLHDRQKEILKTIVELYIKNEKPVSSDEVLENSNIKASSATIRNYQKRYAKTSKIRIHLSTTLQWWKNSYKSRFKDLFSNDKRRLQPRGYTYRNSKKVQILWSESHVSKFEWIASKYLGRFGYLWIS